MSFVDLDKKYKCSICKLKVNDPNRIINHHLDVHFREVIRAGLENLTGLSVEPNNKYVNKKVNSL